jgi:acetyl esterase/lipase
MPSAGARLFPLVLRLMGARRPYESVEGARARIAEMALRPAPYGPPRRLRQDVGIAVHHVRGWPVYELVPRGQAPQGALVYVHGGGWVHEIHPLHWRLVQRIAAEARLRVVVPIYPLLPRGTALESVEGVAGLVRSEVQRWGPERVSLGGDSAGGQIALSAAVLLRDADALQLRRILLISPALDLTLGNPEMDAVEPTDPWLHRAGVRHLAEKWRGALPLTDPRVSPLFAELGGLAPLAIFTGTRDITNPDAHLLARKAKQAGVPVDFHEEAGLVHVHPLLPLPEGGAARRAIIALLKAPG